MLQKRSHYSDNNYAVYYIKIESRPYDTLYRPPEEYEANVKIFSAKPVNDEEEMIVDIPDSEV